MEVMLTVFPSLELVENSVGERSEAMGTDKAAGVEQLAITVDYLGFGLETIVTASTGDAV